MRIFFTTPYSGKHHFQPFIDEILAELHRNNAVIISPEDSEQYQETVRLYESEGLPPEKAHYTYITHGIAEADAVIVEASHESFRTGHEATLALLYGKPTLVLSQKKDYADHIPHELFVSGKYETKQELKQMVRSFMRDLKKRLEASNDTVQTIEAAADTLRLSTLSGMRQKALHDKSDFGRWARLAETDQEKTYRHVEHALGNLPIHQPWSKFAEIYNEDTPDYIFAGITRFAHSIFKEHHIHPNDLIVDAVTQTGSIARNLHAQGYSNISAFNSSREMLSETFRLCAQIPDIKPFEADIADVKLSAPANAIIWTDFTSNFALTTNDLQNRLQNLIDNLQPAGCLIFDIRTITGWNVSFFRQKVTTFATPNFQRVWINLPDDDKKLIAFDIFIRTRQRTGLWGEWHREQMQERMWSLSEVRDVTAKLKHCTLKGIYGDDFSPVSPNEEPGLAYFVLTKI